MSKQKFCEVVDYLCERLQMARSDEMYEGLQVAVEGIGFTLGHGGDTGEDTMLVYCDFGEPHTETKTLTLRRVLETNAFTFGMNAPIFGLSPGDEHLLVMHRLTLSQMNGEAVLRTLTSLAEYVYTWRKVIFAVPSEQELALAQHG